VKEIIQAAGWPIWPIILASLIAVTIILFRFLWMRPSQVAPGNLLDSVVLEFKQKGANADMLNRLAQGSLLGKVFAAGLKNVKSSREVMKESIEEAGHAATHELERFLTTLGTIASVSPLLGLFGTVVGMIEIFGAQSATGTSPAILAHGISVALYNTAFGLMVAIPSMIFYRHFRSQVEAVVVAMEQQAVKLVEIVHGERQ